MARSRREARESALQVLYEMEIGRTPMAEALNENLMTRRMRMPPELEAYAERLVKGVYAHKWDLDAILRERTAGYGSLERLATVDRNLLRLALYELYHEPDLAPAVTIDEAVELAKRYSTADSGRFVNGVLGRALQDSPKANWTPPERTPDPEPEVPDEPEEPVVEETVEEDSEEAKNARRFGWVLRSNLDP